MNLADFASSFVDWVWATPLFLLLLGCGLAFSVATKFAQWRVLTHGLDFTEVLEAAIDAISCFQLLGDCICVSTAGVRVNPPWLPPLLARGFDNDEPGETTAREMMARHSSIDRLRPPAHDWNEAIVSGG